VNRTLPRACWPLPGLLAVVLLAIPTPARSAGPPAIPPAVEYISADVDAQDRPKQIADLEREIAELQKKLAELKKSPATAPAPKPVTVAAAGTLPESFVKKMTWRAIGPASMGGRVTAIAVVESDPATYYVATASGGLIKTTNNGTTFSHLFDKETTVSIGDVAVAPSDPNVVWVGTGENNPRNSVSAGDGVYKSTDAGKTWTNMGLKKSFQVGKIVVHPKDPNTVYVGALGRLYGPNEERGLFKTADGGKTWNKVLYVDDRTGVIDFRMDPFNPEVLLVGLWERRRDEFDTFYGPADKWPTTDQYGPATTYGPGGGLFKTADGGKSWKKLTDDKLKSGLPTVKLGRIGLDYSRKTKGLVFAIIDTERVGMGRPVLSVYVGLSTEDNEGGGIKVTLVADDGPAGKGGVKEDDVITQVDDKKIDNYDTFIAYLATRKPGDVVKVTVRRGKKEQVIEVKLVPKETVKEDEKGAKEPEPKKKGPAPKGGNPPVLGIQIAPSPDGIEVEAVTPDGPAAKAGIEKGDIITAVAGKKVADQASLRVVLATFKAGDKVKVTVVNEKAKKAREVEVTLGAPQGGRGQRAVNPNRPFLMSPVVGGQRANAQDQQGRDGFQTGGVYMSKDGGDTWARVNSLNPRPFYFSQIRVDPTDDNTLYVAGDTSLWKSTNGGKKFDGAPSRGVHPDHHALWIDPKDGRHMLLGCDGGFYVTYDRGTNWDHLNVLALGQFYHVAVDNRKPYRVYGGLQDNGSWGGPSHVLRGVGPVNEDWSFLLGGDGFVCRVDPSDPDIVYAESQGGNIRRQNLRTGEQAGIGAAPVVKGEELRWNWNTPFILSHHNPSIFYSGAQYVFRSVTKGTGTKAISPEITRTKHGTATALAESPRTPDVVWAGTDDGYLWVTRDGGQKWENVYEKLRAAGLPGPRWVSSIEASKVKDGRCYVVLDAHRSDDDRPYVFVTEDYGQTWQSLTANLGSAGWTRVLREDHVNPDLLYLGTELGIWVSVNRGGSWTRLNNNLPTVAVHEVAQPTTASEVVVATHGRSIWVLDVASLRQMSPHTEKGSKEEAVRDPLKDPVTLFAPAPAVRWKLEGGRESPYSLNVRKFYGTNPDRRASIDYVLTKPAKELSLKVQDVTGKTVWDFRNAPKEAGFHRQAWALTRTGGGGIAVPAGSYRVLLVVDGKEYSQPIAVENDPNADPKAVISLEEDQRTEEDEEREREGWDEEEE
jgi:photosystem II stability/assembly factor-like uncharacterized protein